MGFCVWLISLSIVLSAFIHVVLPSFARLHHIPLHRQTSLCLSVQPLSLPRVSGCLEGLIVRGLQDQELLEYDCVTSVPRQRLCRGHTSRCCLVTQSCLTLATPWTVAPQAPLSMGFSRWEYWRGLPVPSPEDLPDPGMEPTSPALVGGFFTIEPLEAQQIPAE